MSSLDIFVFSQKSSVFSIYPFLSRKPRISFSRAEVSTFDFSAGAPAAYFTGLAALAGFAAAALVAE